MAADPTLRVLIVTNRMQYAQDKLMDPVFRHRHDIRHSREMVVVTHQNPLRHRCLRIDRSQYVTEIHWEELTHAQADRMRLLLEDVEKCIRPAPKSA